MFKFNFVLIVLLVLTNTLVAKEENLSEKTVDTWLYGKVISNLSTEPFINANTIKVKIDKNHVVLTGEVISKAHRDAVVGLIEKMEEVEAVTENLIVKTPEKTTMVDPSPYKQELIEAVQDTVIATNIKSKLLTTRIVETSDVTVEVVEGIVYLSGFVPTKAQKTILSTSLETVVGVKKVEVDTLTVKPMQKAVETIKTKESIEKAKEISEEVIEGTSEKAQEVTEDVVKGAKEMTEKAQETTEDVVEGAKEMTEDVVEGAKEMTEKAQETTEDVVEGAKEMTEDVVEGAKEMTEKAQEATEDLPEKTMETTENLVEETEQRMKDSWILANIQTKLITNQEIDSRNLTFEVKESVVFISGSLPDKAQKDLLIQFMQQFTEVKDIKYQIVIL